MSRLKWIFLAAVLVFCLIMIFQNSESTEVRMLTMSFQLPQADAINHFSDWLHLGFTHADILENGLVGNEVAKGQIRVAQT